MDFTLLKRSNLAELKRGVFFKTRWGNVRPSWHLECAAISMKYLSERFDIHASGADIVFPHCENVMAIGKAATGKNIAEWWVNTELVMRDGQKMSRALNNIYTLQELMEKGYRPREVRFFLLSSHYRKPLNFSFGALETARNTVRNLDVFIQRLIQSPPGKGCPDIDQLLYDLKLGFTEAMDDDFNVSQVFARLFEFVRKVNAPLNRGEPTGAERNRVLDTLKKIDSVLAVMDFSEEKSDEETVALLRKRDAARRARNWAESDRIRDLLWEKGILLQDTQEGTRWWRK